jgi:hypothetical protein
MKNLILCLFCFININVFSQQIEINLSKINTKTLRLKLYIKNNTKSTIEINNVVYENFQIEIYNKKKWNDIGQNWLESLYIKAETDSLIKNEIEAILKYNRRKINRGDFYIYNLPFEFKSKGYENKYRIRYNYFQKSEIYKRICSKWLYLTI